jgi:folylpolyglutamate synthase/dihydropteroate synthase
MKDKNHQQMLKFLKQICDTLTVIDVSITRSAQKDEISLNAKRIGFNKIYVAKSVQDAIMKIRYSNIPTIVCGSFFIMEEVVNSLKKYKLYDK